MPGSREAWEREYTRVQAYTTSYRDDLDRGVQFLLGFLERRQEPLEGPLLECGCGRGRNALALAGAGHSIIGLDHAWPALMRFRERALQESSDARVLTLQHDLRQALPLTDASVAAVLDITAVDNLVDPQQRRNYGLEVARVLRPGGWMLVVTFALDDGYYGRWLTASASTTDGVVEDPHTGIRNQLFSADVLDAVFCPPLERHVAGRLVFVDDAAEKTWIRRFLLHLYRRRASSVSG